MVAGIRHTLLGVLSFLVFGINTILCGILIYLLIPIKLVVPTLRAKTWTTHKMVKVGELWIAINSGGLKVFHNIQWNVSGVEGLRRDRSYLVCSNHRSWVDIVVLQKVFNRRIPFLRFFLKQQLIYVPILGGAWWALDFPFMKRHSKEFLEKHPERRGEDLATIRKVCARFKGRAISILNFAEGTRFTPAKHQRQNSPFQKLLNPKVGGIAFVLEAMGEQFESFIDVTINYPDGDPKFWDLLSGRIRRVNVLVRQLPIPAVRSRGEIHIWLRDIWEAKDRTLVSLQSQAT